MTIEFLRSDTTRHLRLGKKRRKLQKWRKPKGRHNKIRKKRFSYPIMPAVGFKKEKDKAGKINGLKPVLIYNLDDLSRITKEQIGIIARNVGAKKKLDILKKAEEVNIPIFNIWRKK